MFRPMQLASVLWLATLITSCDFLPSSKTTKDSVVAAPKVLTAVEFLDELPILRLPDYAKKLGPVPVGFLGLNMPAYFSLKEAGRLPAEHDITPVIYRGSVQGRKVVYLFTYDKAGKEIARLQLCGDGFVEPQHPAYDEHYKDARLDVMFVADTMIELKCNYYFVNVEKKAAFFYEIKPDGMIAPMAKDTVSLLDFAAAFPLKEKPWHMGAVNMKGLELVSRLTPYFNFGEVSNDKVYAYGRIEQDDLPPVLLFGIEGEKLNLITYNEQGKLAGSLIIKDSISRDGESTATGNCRVNGDGVILLDEVYRMRTDGYEFMEKKEMRYVIQTSGSIIPEEATQITITSPMFQKEYLMKFFRTTEDESFPQSVLLSEIPSLDRLSVHMSFYKKGEEYLVELYTRSAVDGKLRDCYQLLNTLNKVPYGEAGARDEEPDREEYVVEKRGHYTKNVLIKLPGIEMHVDAKGRFVK